VALTLLDTVLLGALVVLVLLLLGDALNALVVVVLVGGTLGGVGAFYMKGDVSKFKSKAGLKV
jgi:hypothetical protein